MAIHRAAVVRRGAVVLTALALGASLSACSRVPGVYTYVPAGQEKSAGAGRAAAFDATAYVDGIWAGKVLPTVTKDAVPASELLPALEADQAAASKEYGNQTGTGSPFAFLVKGTGTVTAIDKDAPTHPLTVRVDGVSGKGADVQVVTGPVIAGTALRDAVRFITFGDFTNQLNYADAGTALNSKVKTEVLGKLEPASLVGKKVTFAGAFSLVAPGVVLVVPTQLQAAS
ncbi:DUF2291 domain-containing protein [Terrabacter sp. NPDC000476]|uniref:DUF2291 family protein n=1 Tax=Terrabacter sp. NPDC000476 TaxID=3154258 RepID=UPI00331E49E4